jgi:hypothetical protein
MGASTLWAVVLIVAAIAAITLAFAIWRGRRRTDRDDLRQRFGPEYDHLVEEYGSGKAARRELRHRLRRVERYSIRELSPDAHARFSGAWAEVQARFVDDPAGAVQQSDRLIHEVMRARGYPIEKEFDAQIADLSVHHSNVVQHYRAARELSRGVHEGHASTEDLRQAMVHHRALFADLLREPIDVVQPQREELPA